MNILKLIRDLPVYRGLFLQGRPGKCSSGGRLQEDWRRDPEELQPEHDGPLPEVHRHPPAGAGQVGPDPPQERQVRAGLPRL